MRKLKYFFAACLAGGIVFFSVVSTPIANAAPRSGTSVSGNITADTVWDEAGSPYLLAGPIWVNPGQTLTIGPGVTVESDPKVTGTIAQINIDHGTLNLAGTADKHVTVSGISNIFVENGTTTVSYSDMRTQGIDLQLYGSHTEVNDSTFASSSGTAIYIWNGVVDIERSRIENNAYAGVIVLADNPTAPQFVPADVSIHDSEIQGNGQYAVWNRNSSSVKADKNWWGSLDGPVQTGPNRVSGPVLFTPWATSTPILSAVPHPCCSSILFIPGLEGTRLYRDEWGIAGIGGFLIGTTTNRLWEPNRNLDVKKLFLNPDGTSADPTVYSGDPIGKAFGLVSVYGKFMGFLDGLVGSGQIGEWKSFGYDWRKPVSEVVAGSEKKATTTESLIQTVTDLASRSKTGKVTLIAHSNGGLVAKYLVKALADLGKSDLIDTVISVAVPYLGTPQAIAALLYGDDQAILHGLILKQSVAQSLGQNMPSAYSLLPSAGFFTKVFTPTIAYASGIADNHDSQSLFIRGAGANSALMAAADVLHGIIDPFSWPATIARYAIVGWNELKGGTTKEVVYTGQDHHVDAKTAFGDGTVMTESAAYNAGTTTAIDLSVDSRSEAMSLSHSNILESSTAEAAIGKIVSGGGDAYCSEISKLPGASCGEPDYTKPEPSFFTLSTHSPVELHVYDAYGNHTGVTGKPAGLDEDVEDGLFIFHDENIPGSGWSIQDDGTSTETFIRLPDNGQKYSVEIRGTGVGTFLYEVQRERGSVLHDNTILGHAEYDGIPVMLSTVATTSLQFAPVSLEATTTPGFVSLAQPLYVDIDGDGAPDLVATSTASSVSADPGLYCRRLTKLMSSKSSKLEKDKNLQDQLAKLNEVCDKLSLLKSI
jgi:hypothetical protein